MKHSAEIFADATVSFLGSEITKKPFFLYVAKLRSERSLCKFTETT